VTSTLQVEAPIAKPDDGRGFSFWPPRLAASSLIVISRNIASDHHSTPRYRLELRTTRLMSH
jgi:hypothetical protein